MQVKTFEGISIKSAISAVKAEFGNDAVILSTKDREDRASGQKIYEVTAARPETREFGAVSASSHDGLALRKRIDQLEANLTDRMAALTDTMSIRQGGGSLEAGLSELKLLVLEGLRAKDGLDEEVPSHLSDLKHQLSLMGVDHGLLNKLFKHLESLPAPSDRELERESLESYYQAQAIRWMLRRIRVAPKWTVGGGSVAVHCLMGTPGCGKTSMAAKLAAHYHRREKTSTLLVSFDTARLAAAEQLRLYAKILGVPFEVVSSAAELEAVLKKHKDVELVLIDTSGHSVKTGKAIEPLKALKDGSLPIDFHLVLSLTEKERQSDWAIRQFSPIGIQSLLFAKLDEAWSYGDILNLSSRWSVPLSFFSTSSEVPEGFERSTKERVVERIFGL